MKQNECIRPAKVAIVGVGNVGSTTAYSLMIDGVVSELALIDKNTKKVQGEILDLQHGMQFTPSVKITGGDSFSHVEGAHVVIISAGFAQKPRESRTDLLEKNVQIFKEIIPEIAAYNKDCILLIVTNPLDVLTYVSWKLSGFDSCKVFGSGTVLDTARFRYLLGEHLKVSPKDITAYVLGEHGETEFAWWSKAMVAGTPLSSIINEKDRTDIMESVRSAASEVIEHKGATYYAISLVVTKIVRAILLDQSRVFTLSTVLENVHGIESVCTSIPTVVRMSGICQRFDADFDAQEKEAFMNSMKTVCENIKRAKAFL